MNDHRYNVEEILIEHNINKLTTEDISNLSDEDLFNLATPLVKILVSEETGKGEEYFNDWHPYEMLDFKDNYIAYHDLHPNADSYSVCDKYYNPVYADEPELDESDMFDDELADSEFGEVENDK